MRHHTTTRLAGLVGLVLAAAFAGCSADDGTPAARGAEPTTPSAAEPTSDCPSDFSGDLLPAGCLSIGIGGSSDTARLELDLPAGFRSDGSFIWWHHDTTGWQGLMGLSTAGPVYADPCLRYKTADAGTTVEEFVDRLGGQSAAEATAPTPVSVGGQDGQYVELAVPQRFRFDSCENKVMTYWAGAGGIPEVNKDIPGPLRTWVIQVGDERLAIGVLLPNDATPKMIERFTDVIETATWSQG